MSYKISDIADTIFDHGRTLKTEAPSNHCHVFIKAKRTQHFRSKDARIAYFNPFLETYRRIAIQGQKESEREKRRKMNE